MASNIELSDLIISPGIGHNIARWTVTDPNSPDGLPYRKLDKVELWAASSNDRSGASKVAEGTNSTPHMGLTEGQTFYYWIKARDQEGSYGDWYPSGSTSGVIGTVGFASATTALVNGKIVCSVAANALTVAIKTLSGNDPSSTDPVFCGFRDESGSYTVRSITGAQSSVVPSGATLGVVNGTAFRLWFLLVDIGGGSVSIAVSNRVNSALNVYGLSEYGIFNDPKPLNTSSDSAGVIYWPSSDELQHAFRVIGFADWESGLTAAGTWDDTPDRTVMFGPGIRLAGEYVNQNVVRSVTVETATGDIPYDDTIPQNTEGTQVTYLDNPVYPASVVNVIEVEFELRGSNSNSSSLLNTAALFRQSVANALCVDWGKQAAVDEPLTLRGVARSLAGTTSPRTYSVRVGGSTNGASSFTVNGIASSRKYGGAMASTSIATEIMA